MNQTILNSQPTSTTLKFIAYICFAIGLSSFWGISQFHHLDNTRNGLSFFFLFAILGLILSIPFYLLIYKTVPELKKKQKVNHKWSTGISGLGMGFFFLTPAIACYINKTHLSDADRCNNYKITDKGRSGGRSHEYYIFVNIDNYNERLTVFKPYWETLRKGQFVRLCLQRGILGFDYIKIDK